MMGIGDIAARFGLAAHVLRHWETVGLLSPARNAAGRRRYGTADLYRVAVILSARQAGFGLEDIRAMITAPGPAARAAILRGHRATLVQRITAARASLDMIDGALGCEHEDFTQCLHFQAMVHDQISRDPLPS